MLIGGLLIVFFCQFYNFCYISISIHLSSRVGIQGTLVTVRWATGEQDLIDVRTKEWLQIASFLAYGCFFIFSTLVEYSVLYTHTNIIGYSTFIVCGLKKCHFSCVDYINPLEEPPMKELFDSKMRVLYNKLCISSFHVTTIYVCTCSPGLSCALYLIRH